VSEPPFSRVGVVGLGLIGGSIALAARRAWPAVTIVGCDRSAATARAAVGGVVHEAVDINGLKNADLIILAVPIAAMAGLMQSMARLDTMAVITDVGSTKRHVMGAASSAGLKRFVGGHPMGGSERTGLDHARADMFAGRPWLLVQGPGGEDESARLERFVKGLGAVPQWTDADTHDRIVAYVSHLPQVLAVALKNAASGAVGDAGLSASGRAFAEMTRLAASPADLWQGILSDNADFVAEALDRFVKSLPKDGQLDTGAWVREAFGKNSKSV